MGNRAIDLYLVNTNKRTRLFPNLRRVIGFTPGRYFIHGKARLFINFGGVILAVGLYLVKIFSIQILLKYSNIS